jgi:hypothetical protein
MKVERIPITCAVSIIARDKKDLPYDPNYFLRAHSLSFRFRLAICRGLYKLQKYIMESAFSSQWDKPYKSHSYSEIRRDL